MNTATIKHHEDGSVTLDAAAVREAIADLRIARDELERVVDSLEHDRLDPALAAVVHMLAMLDAFGDADADRR